MAKVERWSDDWVRSLEHPPKGQPERVFRDPRLAGHRLTVTRQRKRFEVQADVPKQFANGKRKTFVVVVGDGISTRVEEARQRGLVVLARIKKGEDPRGRTPEPETSLGGAWDDFLKRSDLRPGTRAIYAGIWDRCLSKWKDRTLRYLVDSPRVVKDEHAEITKKKGPSEADHAMRLLRSVFRHAAKLDTSLPGDRTPTSAVEWHGDRKREGAAIPAGHMPTWNAQLQALRRNSPVRAAFHMLCLRLGTRPGELARARWSDVDWERCILTLPETKTHLVEIPLPIQAVAELKELRKVAALNKRGADFVFPSRGKEGHLKRLVEDKTTLSHTGNCGRHCHHTLGTKLEINELVLDVLEGRSLKKAGAAGRGYIDVGELGPKLRDAQAKINAEIDRLFGSN